MNVFVQHDLAIHRLAAIDSWHHTRRTTRVHAAHAAALAADRRRASRIRGR